MKARRDALKIRQIPFAKMIGVSQPHLSRLEAGAAWSAAQVSAACAILGCNPSDLMDESPPSALKARIAEAIDSGDYMAAVEALTALFKGQR